MLRFQPAAKAIFVLINQRTPADADRCALTQCLMEYYKTVRDPTRSFESQFPRLVFGSLYGQTRLPASPSTQYLEAFKTQKLLCPITGHIVNEGVSMRKGNETVMVDASVGLYYNQGVLRRTVFNEHEHSDHSQIRARLCRYNGGHLKEVTYFQDGNIRPSRATTLPPPTAAPVEFHDPFAIIPPKDLRSVHPSTLTRDATGVVSVYLGSDTGKVKYNLSLQS
jgi:hypothetical protein